MKKRSTSEGMMVTSEPYKKPKPSLMLTDKDLPAIKDWKVGKTYNMEIVVKMVHRAEGSEYEFERSDSDHRAKFEIMSIDSMPQENASIKKK